MILNNLTNYGRRHSKLFTNCHVSGKPCILHILGKSKCFSTLDQLIKHVKQKYWIGFWIAPIFTNALRWGKEWRFVKLLINMLGVKGVPDYLEMKWKNYNNKFSNFFFYCRERLIKRNAIIKITVLIIWQCRLETPTWYFLN